MAHRQRHNRPTAKSSRALLLAGAVFFLFAFAGTAPVQAAHPLRLTDYTQQTRIGLEIAYGKATQPIEADFVHYLLEVEANVAPGVHVRLGLPFSGYSGPDGTDNFIRGNLLVGAGYQLPLADWVSLGFELRLYLPTYERAHSIDYGLGQDPRRAMLTHWHYRFQYALEDSFPITPSVALRFSHAGFFAQLEGGFTWAPNIRERSEVVRKDTVWLLQYGLGLGYDFFGWVEVNASFTSLYDPDAASANMGDVLGLAFRRPRTLSAFSVGPRFQYKWFAARVEANIPLESRFRDMTEAWFLFAAQVQF